MKSELSQFESDIRKMFEDTMKDVLNITNSTSLNEEKNTLIINLSELKKDLHIRTNGNRFYSMDLTSGVTNLISIEMGEKLVAVYVSTSIANIFEITIEYLNKDLKEYVKSITKITLIKSNDEEVNSYSTFGAIYNRRGGSRYFLPSDQLEKVIEYKDVYFKKMSATFIKMVELILGDRERSVIDSEFYALTEVFDQLNLSYQSVFKNP